MEHERKTPAPAPFGSAAEPGSRPAASGDARRGLLSCTGHLDVMLAVRAARHPRLAAKAKSRLTRLTNGPGARSRHARLERHVRHRLRRGLEVPALLPGVVRDHADARISGRRGGSARPMCPAIRSGGANQRLPRGQLKPVRLTDHGVLAAAHAPANSRGGVAFCPQGAQPGDGVRIPIHQRAAQAMLRATISPSGTLNTIQATSASVMASLP